jgi:replicative DNA helicase
MSTDKKKHKKKEDVEYVMQGKTTPQATDLEEAVLGAILLEREAIETVVKILKEECFYKTQNQLVYKAALSLYRQSQPIDILTVTQELKKTNELETVGGPYYVSTLTNRIAGAGHIEAHARIVLERYLKRELIRVNTENTKAAYTEDSDVFDLYNHNISSLEGALSGVIKFEAKPIRQLHEKNLYDQLQAAEHGAPTGVPSHYRAIDNYTNGWQKTDLIILAGRPGMGKTAAAVCFAIKPALESDIPVAIFSLEMSSEQLTARIQSQLSGLNVTRVNQKKLSKEEAIMMDRRCTKLYEAPIFIDDTPGLNLLDLRSKARTLVNKHKVKLIVIDYLQLMESGNNSFSREQEVSMISRGLKKLAKELNIPIIALSQLSRAVESRADKKPQLSDLRESGAIEQDADLIMFCFRPEYYESTEYVLNNETYPAQGLFSLIIAKNRHGATTECVLGFINELAMITNYDKFNKRPEYSPPSDPQPNTSQNTNKDFDSSEKNYTFVQNQNNQSAELNKLSNNDGFLNQQGTNNKDEDAF